MTKFPCDYCGGREMDLDAEKNEQDMCLSIRPPKELCALIQDFKYEETKDTEFVVCPWCLKKVFDIVLKGS